MQDDTKIDDVEEVVDNSLVEEAELVESPDDDIEPAEEVDSISSDDEEQPVDVLSEDGSPGALTRILDLERSIKTYYQSLLAKKEELKNNREMVNDALTNDKLYEEHQQQAEEVKRKQNKLREQVMNIPSILVAKEEMKNLGQEIKDMQKTLSKFLLEYRRLSNSNQIQVTDGEFFDIVEDAKLMKSKRME